MSKLKSILSSVAPSLGAALGGPLGAIAGRTVAQALGRTGAGPDEVAAILEAATPEELLALKRADLEFQQLLLDGVRADSDDRANARAREQAMRDWTPTVLAYGTTVGFFGILAAMLAGTMPDNGAEPLLIMLGSLGAAWTGIVAYYFGSSAGSKLKDLSKR